jgi:hypothetical protein
MSSVQSPQREVKAFAFVKMMDSVICLLDLLQCANAHIATTFAFRVSGLAYAKTLGNIGLRKANLLANLRKHILAVKLVRLGLDACAAFRRHLRHEFFEVTMSAHFVSSSISFKYCS